METHASLAHLPLEILLGIAPYLDPIDFISLCRTCHLLHDTDELFYSARYWSEITRKTFRVRNWPVIEGDGRRWMQLYRRMRTQTKLYTWGNNDGGCLGGEILGIGGGPSTAPRPTRLRSRWNSFLDPQSATWPRETSMGNVGVISDLQCGGWSTTVLNSRGALATVGILNNMRGQVPSPTACFHEYPAGYTSPANSSGRYDPYTAIQQFSAGRTHVLGLSDTGRIWSWSSSRRPGRQIKFFSQETRERTGPGTATKFGFVKQVVAGWDRSTAHIVGVGIVVWEPSLDATGTEPADTDTTMVLQNWVIPNTEFHRSTKANDELNDRERYLADSVGEVTNYIVLEHCVLFATDLGKLFLWRKQGEADGVRNVVVELLVSMRDDLVVDVQGSFRSFVVFTKSGTVLTGTRESLDEFIEHHPALQGETNDFHVAHPITLTKIPCLQHNSVISMAFGDYHSHALHADGTITSYGHEPQYCGALGLGGECDGIIRGVGSSRRTEHRGPDLIPESYTTGRRVHFEPEKEQWLDYLCLADLDRREAEERLGLLFEDDAVRAEVSEWFEQRLRAWEHGGPSPDTLPEIPSTAADGLPAYFALTVAAAGWHSGALVLVNEAKAARTRASYRVPLPSDYKEYVPIFDEPRPYHLTSGGSTALLSPATGADAQRPQLQRNPSSSLLERAADGVRWVLGAPARSNAGQGGSRSRTPSPAVGDGAAHKTLEERARQIDEDNGAAREKRLGPRKWAWEGTETFPRFVLANGETLPGQAPVVGWPEGTAAPAWKEVEVVQI